MKELFKQLPRFLQHPDPNVYTGGNYVLLDFETTNLDNGDPLNPANSLVCAQYSLGALHPDYWGEDVRVVYGTEFEQSELLHLIAQADFIVAHNAKFELGWLRRCGLELGSCLSFCTQIGEYVIAGNRKWPLGLDACLRRRGFKGKIGSVSKLIHAKVCPSEIPRSLLTKYAVRDVTGLRSLFLSQRDTMQELNLFPVAFTRNIFTAPLVDIESRGMYLDAGRVEAVHHKYATRLAEVEAQFSKLTNGANPKSTKQMREVIYDRFKFAPPTDHRGNVLLTPGGETKRKNKEEFDEREYWSTDSEAIQKLKATTAAQKEFVTLKKEIGHLKDALSKTLSKFHACVEETKDHILTASLNQTITQTHRLSSSGRNYKAQFQNFPRAFKPLFAARNPGWLVGEIDQASLEFRTAAFLGQDKIAMDKIKDKFDVHKYTASVILEKPMEQITKAERQAAKPDTFGPLYGKRYGTPGQTKYFETFRAMYPEITNTQETWCNDVLNTGRLRTASGLLFYWSDTRLFKSGFISNSTQIYNYPIQSFATADIVPIGVTYQWHLMRIAGLQSFLTNTIHDSSIAEVHPEEIEQFTQIGERSFVDLVYWYLRRVYNVEFNVPLEAEVSLKSNWSDSEDWKQEYLSAKVSS